MKDNYYVDNKKFYNEFVKYKQVIYEAENSGEERPTTPDYIAECILKIAESLSYRYNFINYTFREDMVSDAIENALTYAHNFDPKKTKNPFGYFTKICYWAFLRRIEREKKQYYIRYKLIEDSGIMDDLAIYEEQDENAYMLNSYKEYLRSHSSYSDYYDKEEIKKEKRKQQRRSKQKSKKKS